MLLILRKQPYNRIIQILRLESHRHLGCATARRIRHVVANFCVARRELHGVFAILNPRLTKVVQRKFEIILKVVVPVSGRIGAPRIGSD